MSQYLTVTLYELDTHWSLNDVLDAHLALNAVEKANAPKGKM